MMSGFRRSLSLVSANSSASSPRGTKGTSLKNKSLHVRSTSLPCRSHPIVSQIEDEIRALRSWQAQPKPECGSVAWLCTGLDQLELLHQSLEDLLRLPHTQVSLRRRSMWSGRILEHFLHFADAYGVFRSAIVEMKQEQLAAQVAVRRKDKARLASYLRYQSKTEKELIKLSSRVHEISKSKPELVSDAGEAELVGIMRELTSVIASTSESVFLGVVAASAASSLATSVSPSSRTSSLVSVIRRRLPSPNKKKGMEEGEERKRALEKLEELEECIDAMESEIERIFRRLVNTRVSLLNILSCS